MVRREVVTFGGIRVDSTRWPVLVMEFPPAAVKDADLLGALDRVEEFLRSGEKSFQITDLSRITEMASANQRKLSGEWSARTIELQRAQSLGGCLVIASALVRGLVTAVHWVKAPVTPTTIVATRQEADAVAEAAIGKAGLRRVAG